MTEPCNPELVTFTRGGYRCYGTTDHIVYEDIPEVIDPRTKPPTIRIHKGPYLTTAIKLANGSIVYQGASSLFPADPKEIAELEAKERAAEDALDELRRSTWCGGGPSTYTVV